MILIYGNRPLIVLRWFWYRFDEAIPSPFTYHEPSYREGMKIEVYEIFMNGQNQIICPNSTIFHGYPNIRDVDTARDFLYRGMMGISSDRLICSETFEE